MPTSLPLELDLDRPARTRVLVAALAGGLAVDLAIRSGLAGAGGALCVVVASVVVLSGAGVTNPQARWMVVLAPAFGGWLAVRTSPWLLPLDAVAAGGLLVAAAALARQGSVLDLGLTRLLGHALRATVHGALGLAHAVSPLGRIRPRLGPGSTVRARGAAVARGVALTLPVVLVLGALLASADAVFASFVRIELDVDPASVALHVVALVAGAWGVGALLRLAEARPAADLELPAWRLGRLEAKLVTGSLVVLFGAFAVAQVVAATDGGRRVLETAGLTYAEYGRSGFFQLLAVAALTLPILLAIRALAAGRTGFGGTLIVLSLLAVLLTLVVVGVAVRRLQLYEQAYGLTMLRLYSELFALWIGGVFVLVGLWLAGVGRRPWFVAGAAGLGLALLLGLNVANPEALVVRHNVAHAETTGRFDLDYVAGLSDDAVPTLATALPTLPPADRQAVRAALCAAPSWPFEGWAAWNLGRDRAERVRGELCAAA
jgi:hypothetical protein